MPTLPGLHDTAVQSPPGSEVVEASEKNPKFSEPKKSEIQTNS